MPRRISASIALILGAATAAAQTTPTAFSSLQWRSIGPVNTGGRIDDIAVARIAGQPDAIYVATASGGVFKSSNNGVSFTPIFDDVNAMMSIGAVAVAPSAPNTVWVGTGEANTRQSSSWGDGVYKSTDGGKTWRKMGLADTKSIGRIVIDPNDPDVVYVAAQGHLWGPNAERGVFKTTDGGQTWKKVLFVDENTGANDIVMDPHDPQTLFASTYQRQRRTWGFNGGGPGSGIYKTTDGGATWTKLTNGLPSGDKGRISLALFPEDPRVVFATVEARGAGNGIYKTTDGGATWQKTSSLNTRPNYFSEIRVDAHDQSHVYSLGSNRGFYFSDDGGHAWTEKFSNVHGEDHALWVDPQNGNHMIIGGDGGVSITWDRGQTWDFRRNMPIGQFYEIDVDHSTPFRICGGLQDNGVWCTPSAVRNENGIADRDAWNIGGGDGMHALFDPANDDMVLQSSQNGNAAWVNIVTMERQGVRPGTGDRPALPPARGEEYRWNWDTPMIKSSHDPKVWYMGAQYLFKSTNRGSSWTKISPDLTLDANRDTLKMMGSVIPPDALSRNDGQEEYGALVTIGESPLDPLVVYTGSDDGQLQVTRDGGKTWKNVTRNVPGVPDQTYVSSVLPSKYKAGRVYVTFDGHFTDDYKPYIFVSEDYGQTWRSIVGNLPETSVNRLREHPTDPNLLVIGHSRGASFSNDGGATWIPLTTNLPTVPVNDLVFQARDNSLVLGTHGRGLWVLDDVSPLEALNAKALAADATLVPPATAHLMSTFTPQAWYGAGEFFAPNPDWDGVIEYNLHSAATAPATVTIADASGKVIRTLSGPTAAGLNRVVWDLRYEPPVSGLNTPASAAAGGRGGRGGRGGPPAATPVGFPQGRGGRGGAPLGPLVMPGRYAVRVAVPGVAAPLAGTLVVDADPLPKFSAADRAARQRILMREYDWTKALGEARAEARTLMAKRDSIKADVGSPRGDSLVAHIEHVAGGIDRAFNGVTAARGQIEGWSGLPTLDRQKALDYAIDDGRKAIAELNNLGGGDIPAAYNAAGKSAGRPFKPVGVPTGK